MMKKLLPILLLLPLIFSGCSLDQRVENKENRLIGRWTFDKAFYRDYDRLFRDNVYRDFGGDIVEFFGNYEAYYDDAQVRDGYWGEWVISAARDRFDDDDDVEFFMDVFFYDFRGREVITWYACVERLTHNRMTLRIEDRFGVYTLKLRKI